jgi:hypothetical protein
MVRNHFHIAVVEIAHHPGDADFFRAAARKFAVADALDATPHNVSASHHAAFIVLCGAAVSQPHAGSAI